jgi:mono/diheme cytochrome c family protein
MHTKFKVKNRGGWMKKIYCILFLVMAMSASTFATAVSLVGKVTDTTTGAALDSVIVKINHSATADTTDANGVFMITGQVVNILNGIVSRTGPFIQCVGENVLFAVNQQTRVSIEAFSTSGKLLAKPFDKLAAPGAYRVPVGLGVASQIIYIRITCGSDVRVFRMKGAMSRGKARIKFDDMGSKQAQLFKAAAAAPVDTLIISRSGYTMKKVAISSYTSTDSVRVVLWSLYACASDSNGGRLYDKFWAAKAGFSQSDTARINKLNLYADFFRCEQCHGYDLLGTKGTFGNRAPTTKRPNLDSSNLVQVGTESNAEIFKLIKTGDDPTERRAFATDLSTYNPASASSMGDKMPSYADILSDKQIWDLVKFLKTGYRDGKQIYDCSITGTYPNAVVTCSNIGKDGDTALGNTLYNANCKSCHGTDGKKILVDGKSFSVGSHVRAKPYQDNHTIRFHLYGNIPNYSLVQMKNLFKALTDTARYPTPTKADSLCFAANGLNGGRLYDKFWVAETTFSQTDTARYNQYADFFRCEQCHGYDLLGRTGGYANRAPNTKRPNVAGFELFATTTKLNSEIFRLIKTGADSTKRRAPTADLSTYDPAATSPVGDKMPNYGAILSDKQIWDFVRFLQSESFDVKQLYDCTVTGAYPTATVAYSNIGKTGSSDTGNIFYTTNCVACHGADGKKISTADGAAFSVGSHVRAKPNEDFHKIKFGVLGSIMKSRSMTLVQMKNLYKALSDSTKYPNP